MKITVNKVKRELIKSYGYAEEGCFNQGKPVFCEKTIKDTLKVIDDILLFRKNISIRK